MNATRFPLRLKIMSSLLVAMAVVVVVIAFFMGSMFHEDKQSYIRDWVSIAAQGTAEECRSVLSEYRKDLQLYSMVVLNDEMPDRDRRELLEEMFALTPELVEIVIYDGETPVEQVRDSAALAAAEVSADDLRDFRSARPFPMENLLAGDVYVENSTISAGLPLLAIAFATAPEVPGSRLVTAGLLRVDKLRAVGARFKAFEISLVSSDGTLLSHPDTERIARRESAEIPSVFDAGSTSMRAGLTRLYFRGDVEMLGAVADTEFAGVTALVELPRSAANLASRLFLDRLALLASLLLLMVALGARIWSRRITRPMERLTIATRDIAKGKFDVQVEVKTRDEIGELAGSFNQMASELDVRDTQLKDAHAQLVQSEKLAALGQLGAGIAHEVKNPLAGILGCAQLSMMEVESGTPLHNHLQLIEKETGRCKRIIENLLKFSRQERTELEPIEVNQVALDALSIVRHQLEINEVTVITELSDEAQLINGNANQLQQVVMNLLINAQQAMGGKPGKVTLRTSLVPEDQIEIAIRDTGPGIPEEIRTKLFDPFFTTKAPGEGTGLGLSVSYGIVRDHGGQIRVESEPGNGAEFIITLPSLLTVTPQPASATDRG